jgi:hypothetical protein
MAAQIGYKLWADLTTLAGKCFKPSIVIGMLIANTKVRIKIFFRSSDEILSYISCLTLPRSNTIDIKVNIDERMKSICHRVRFGFAMKMYETADWEVTVASRVRHTAIKPSLSF